MFSFVLRKFDSVRDTEICPWVVAQDLYELTPCLILYLQEFIISSQGSLAGVRIAT